MNEGVLTVTLPKTAGAEKPVKRIDGKGVCPPDSTKNGQAREALYESLHSARRTELHFIERPSGNRLVEVAEQLAHR